MTKETVAKPTKDVRQYLEPWLASSQLIYCALNRMLALKPGYRVKWKLSVSYWHDGREDESKVRLGASTFSSSAPAEASQ